MNRAAIASLLLLTGCDAPRASTDEARARAAEQGAAPPAAAHAPVAPAATVDADYDLRFLDTMALHHQHAVDMAKMAEGQAQHDELKRMSADVVKSQGAEIAQLKAWREDWYAGKAPAVSMEMPGMKQSMEGMSIDELHAAEGAAFDHAFIDMMIPHHEGAVAMANDALAKAQHAELKQIARKIIDAQTTELATMRSWSSSWFPGHAH